MPTQGITDVVQMLRQVNLNHLVYFWAVARCGSFTAAAEQLRVSQPTISEQVRSLETRVGKRLLQRNGRGVALTREGEVVMRYADEVVSMCSEMLREQASLAKEQITLQVGLSDTVPKIIAREILKELLSQEKHVSLVCREWRVDHLVSELSLRRLDLLISDAPVDQSMSPTLTSFEARSSGIVFCAAPPLARKLRPGFPKSLTEAPMLLTTPGSAMRIVIDRWFKSQQISPRVLVEGEDRSLLHHFAESGDGVVPVADITLDGVKKQFGLDVVGKAANVRESFYVILVDRPSASPGVDALRQRLSRQFEDGHPA